MRKLKLWGLNQGPPVSRWWSKDSGSEPFGCEVRALGLPPATTVARSRSSQEPSGFGLYPVSRELTPMILYLCFRNNPVAAGGGGPLWLMSGIREVEIANNTFHCSWTAPVSHGQTWWIMKRRLSSQVWERILIEAFIVLAVFPSFLYLCASCQP